MILNDYSGTKVVLYFCELVSGVSHSTLLGLKCFVPKFAG